MYNNNKLGVLFSLAIIPQITGYGQPIGAVQSPPEVHQNVLLKDYLDEVGPKLGCYFTIESIDAAHIFHKSNGEPFRGELVQSIGDDLIADDAPKSIPDLIKMLKSDIPNVNVSVDRNNDKIIHIESVSLENTRDYSIDRAVSFSYDGYLSNLAQYLGKTEGISLQSQRIFVSDDIHYDGVTRVKIKAKAISVRDALTDFIPLKDYNAIIWTSNTVAVKGYKPSTTVTFYGTLE